ncbi:MAG: hypothetical protein EBR82_60545 [Caulobacteraceae bacterium]|nr:hypothetical protein [Caulobacteraceae bacterium]
MLDLQLVEQQDLGLVQITFPQQAQFLWLELTEQHSTSQESNSKQAQPPPTLNVGRMELSWRCVRGIIKIELEIHILVVQRVRHIQLLKRMPQLLSSRK